jgi:glucose/arabinose dehydrogenase
MYVGDLEPDADNPLDQPEEGNRVGQLGAESGRLRAGGDLAVVELGAQRSASLAAEGDLIGEWSHRNYASQSVVHAGVSLSGGGASVVTRYRVIRV